MQEHSYRIRKTFLIPYGITVALLTVLLVLSFTMRGSTIERGILTILLLPALFVLRELLVRKVVIDDHGFSLHRLFRVRTFQWSDITHIGALVIRSKVYILLTTKKGFHIISNAYEGFASLVRDLVDHLPKDDIEVEPEVRQQMEHPTRNIADPAAAWIAAVVLAGLCIVKITS